MTLSYYQYEGVKIMVFTKLTLICYGYGPKKMYYYYYFVVVEIDQSI